jgi:uncharacterized protein (TIGR02118 family)
MVRIVALHGMPDDSDEFLRYYREVHTPIVQRIPGVKNIRFGSVIRMADDSPAPYFLVSDTYFDSLEDLEAALESDEMQEALEDVPNFASGGVTIMFCETEDHAPVG